MLQSPLFSFYFLVGECYVYSQLYIRQETIATRLVIGSFSREYYSEETPKRDIQSANEATKL